MAENKIFWVGGYPRTKILPEIKIQKYSPYSSITQALTGIAEQPNLTATGGTDLRSGYVPNSSAQK